MVWPWKPARRHADAHGPGSAPTTQRALLAIARLLPLTLATRPGLTPGRPSRLRADTGPSTAGNNRGSAFRLVGCAWRRQEASGGVRVQGHVKIAACTELVTLSGELWDNCGA